MSRHAPARRRTIKAIAGWSVLPAASAVFGGGSSQSATGPSHAHYGKDKKPPYKNSSLPVNERVTDLLSRMTVEEKAAQLVTLWAAKSEIMQPGSIEFSAIRASENFPASFGQIARPSDRRGAPISPDGRRARSTSETVRFVNAVQQWAINETRLGIPVLFHEEALHGYMSPGATMFPQVIAMAGTFDLELVRQVHAVIAREMRAHGAQLALTPVVDITRDPRWGRIEETFGEDTFLCAEMGVAAVQGLQGNDSVPLNQRVFATLKHMTGHGQPQSGTNAGPATLSEHELRESFFPPFREAIARAGALAVMPSYNEIDGVPAHVNEWLLRRVLRQEWGYDGLVVSDYHAIEQIQTLHRVARDLPEAAYQALTAGVDCETPEGRAFSKLPELVGSGKLPMTLLDEACRRMLTLKFQAGLFEKPFADATLATAVTGNKEARALALRMAQKSICLLKNDGTLPLALSANERIAVIGPNAAIARLGGYSSTPRQVVSLLDGIREKVAGNATVLHHQGVFITRSEDRGEDNVQLADPAQNRLLIREAVAVARQADVVVLAIGDTEQTSREGYARNHLGDRANLDLLGEQRELFDALRQLEKKMIVVLINGRPPSYPHVVERCTALLECWYPGQEGGTAIADVLFGDVNPGAKLPVTVARSVNQLPLYYNSRPSPRATALGKEKHRTVPLFPFGFGLSYTRFSLGDPVLSSTQIHRGDDLYVDVTIQNTGLRNGDEVVQIYFRQHLSSTVRPRLQLCGFQRVSLMTGETRTVRIHIPARTFAIWNVDLKEVIEPGRFDIMAGTNSADLRTVLLQII